MSTSPKLVIVQPNQVQMLDKDPVKDLLNHFSLTKSFTVLDKNGRGYEIETKDNKCLICNNECNSCKVRYCNNLIYSFCEETGVEQCIGSSPIDNNITECLSYKAIKEKILNNLTTLYANNCDWGLTNLIKDSLGDVLRRQGGKLCIYNGSSKLWSASSNDNYSSYIIGGYINEVLHPIISEHNQTLNNMKQNPSNYDEETIDQAETFTKLLNIMTLETKKISKMCSAVKTLTSSLIAPMEDEAGSPYYFPIRDGKVVDLRSGEISERQQQHNFCFESNFTYLGKDYKCENIEKFMKSVFIGEKEVNYMKSLCGYFLSGLIDDRGYYIFSGTTNGRNGKSVLLEILQIILGGFHRTLMKSALLDGKKSGAQPEIVPLVGGRFAAVSELGKGDRLDIPLIKRLTSKEDEIATRQNYGKVFTFHNKCKLVMATNHDPDMDLDGAIKDRTRLIPFNVQFIDKETYDSLDDKTNYGIADEDFISDLKQNCGDEILTYFVNGAINWFNNKPKFPESFKEATNDYISSQDNFKVFITEKCKVDKYDPKCYEFSTDMLNSYNEWARDNRTPTLNARTLKKEFTTRGFNYGKKDNKNSILGIKLNPLAEI